MGGNRRQIHEGKGANSRVERSRCTDHDHVGSDVGQHLGRVYGCDETNGYEIEGKWEETTIALVSANLLTY